MVDGRTRTGKVINRLKMPLAPQARERTSGEYRAPISDGMYIPNLSGMAAHPEAKKLDYVNRQLMNGSFKEAFDALVTSDGATITMTMTEVSGGDLTLSFSDGLTVFTGTNTIALTAGTDQAPQVNYIYILMSDKILTKSTTGWPSGQHNKIGFFHVPSAAFVQNNGCYVNQNWNDFIYSTRGDNDGHLLHIAEAIRVGKARWFSGVSSAGTQGYLTPTAGNVEFKSNVGVVYQLHEHVFPAFDTNTGDEVLVKNWSGDAFHNIKNLYDIVDDSTGTTIGNNKYFKLVFWGVANKTGEYQPIMINLPSGSYNTEAGANIDESGFNDFSIPREFLNDSSTGFLIASVNIQMKTGGGAWVVNSTTDLRGQSPALATAGSGGIGITDHGALSGLTDDDHTQYHLTDGTRAMTGELDMGANSIGATLQTYTGDGTTTIDFKLGQTIKFTFGAQNDTLEFTNPSNPGAFVLYVKQDGTGSRLITWPANVDFAGGTAPTLSTGGNAIDVFSVLWDGTDYTVGTFVLNKS